MKKMIMVPVVLAILAASVTIVAAQSPLRIAVFDPQRLSEETEEGARVQARLLAMRNKKQEELNALQKEVSDLREKLTAQALSLSPEKKQELEIQIQKKGLELQGAQEAAGRELQLEISSAQNRFQEQLLAVVKNFAETEGFDIILDHTLVAYASPKVDVTTALVDRFNQAVKKPEAAPAAQ